MCDYNKGILPIGCKHFYLDVWLNRFILRGWAIQNIGISPTKESPRKYTTSIHATMEVDGVLVEAEFQGSNIKGRAPNMFYRFHIVQGSPDRYFQSHGSGAHVMTVDEVRGYMAGRHN